MHTTEPGWTADIKQIKSLPYAQMLRQSSVGSVEVGNSVMQRCVVPQAQDTFGHSKIQVRLNLGILDGRFEYV